MRLVTLISSVIVSNLFIFAVVSLAGSFESGDMTIVTVKGNNLIANQGANHNIRVGDSYHIIKGDLVIGRAKVLIVKQSMCGLKVVDLVSDHRPGVGYRLTNIDPIQSEEQGIFDEMENANFRGDRMADSRFSEEPRSHGVKRKGFIIGGGIGGGYLRLQASNGFVSGTANRATFLTDFKIGYAPTNALELYYISKVSWWGEAGTTVILSLSSFGFSIYTDKRAATGLFLTGGAGLAAVDAPFESVDPSYGFGVFGGVGFEFTPHVSIETDLLYSRITDFGVALDSFVIRVMLNVLAF